MTSTLDLSQFNYTQIKLLYCAIDSAQYTTELLIEREPPGRASPPPDLNQADLDALARDGWVTLLGKQIDLEPSIASQIHQQRLIEAIDDPNRAELLAAARPTPPTVVLARIQYQLSDRAILALTPMKAQLKAQFHCSEPQPNAGVQLTEQPTSTIKHLYIMSGAAVGNFSMRIQLPLG